MNVTIAGSTHSARLTCLDEDCGFERATTSRGADPQVRYGLTWAATEHVKATGHRVQFSVLDRITYGPDGGGAA